MRAAIYCRLSDEDRDKTDPQAESESIQNQKSMLLAYAAQRDWEIYNLYCDEDFSGSDRRRPEFLRMLSDAEKQKFDIVLCKTQSRFSRELEIVEKYLHGLFPQWGIRFVSVVDNADTAVKGNKKSRQINGLVNEWYLEDLSDNVRSVLTDKRRKGQHIGSFALYGYHKDPQSKNHLVPDPEAAGVVRMIYELYLSGCGGTRIAAILNERGIPSPAAYKLQQGARYRPAKLAASGPSWSYTTVAAILRNQMYAGDMVQGKLRKASYKSDSLRRTDRREWIVVPDTHEPLIPRGTWQEAQRQLDQRRKPGKAGSIHLFAGKVRCMGCGRALHSVRAKGVKYLRCPSDKQSCDGCSVPLDRLEALVLAQLNQNLDSLYDEKLLLPLLKLPDPADRQIQALSRRAASLQKQADENGAALKNLYLDKLRGVIQEELFTELSGRLCSDGKLTARQLKETQAQLLALERRPRECPEELAERYRRLDALTRPAVSELVDCVYIGKRDPEAKAIPVSIRWNF